MKHLPHTTPFSSPVAAAALDAVPVCMLVLGSSVSKKRDLFQGPYPGKEMLPVASQTETDAGEGIIGLLSNDLFEVLAANTNCPWGSNFAQWRCVVTVKFVEFHDELVTDLLRPSTNERIDDTTPCFRKAAGKDCGIAGTVVVTNDMHRGAYLQGATSQRVYSATDVARLVQEGRLRRDQYADVQASMDCAACYFELELHHLALSDRSECKPSPIRVQRLGGERRGRVGTLAAGARAHTVGAARRGRRRGGLRERGAASRGRPLARVLGRRARARLLLPPCDRRAPGRRAAGVRRRRGGRLDGACGEARAGVQHRDADQRHNTTTGECPTGH